MNENELHLIRILKNKENFSVANHLLFAKDIGDLLKMTKLNQEKLQKILKTLEKAGIIKRNNDAFCLSDVGDRFLRKTFGMEFLLSNANYFLSHSIQEIPNCLIQQIDAFSNCEVVETVWPVSKKMEDIAKEAERFVECIFTEPPFHMAEPLYERVQSGVKLRLLFGRNSQLPDCNDLVERFELNKPKSDSLFEKRICDEVITNLVVSDKGACLMLGDKNSKFDMVYAISGVEEDFIVWCKDFFEFKWKQGHPFARLRTDN